MTFAGVQNLNLIIYGNYARCQYKRRYLQRPNNLKSKAIAMVSVAIFNVVSHIHSVNGIVLVYFKQFYQAYLSPGLNRVRIKIVKTYAK